MISHFWVYSVCLCPNITIHGVCDCITLVAHPRWLTLCILNYWKLFDSLNRPVHIETGSEGLKISGWGCFQGLWAVEPSMFHYALYVYVSNKIVVGKV